MDIPLDESIRRSRSHRHKASNPRFGRDRPSSRPSSRYSNSDISFRNRARSTERIHVGSGRKGRVVSRGQANACIKVTNLHYDVDESDLLELFSEVTSAPNSVQVKIDYDFSGRSNGTAIVTVPGMSAAIAIQNRFDNVPLDGMPMRIEILPSKPANDSDRMGRHGSGRSTRSLDAELDAYMMRK